MSFSGHSANDSQLIARARNFEEEALSELYHRYANSIFRYIYYRIGDRATAEDLVGDVFVRALENLPAYQDTGRPFEAWLYRIAHARVVDHYRRQNVRRMAPLNDRLAAAETTDPAHSVSERDDVRRIAQALLHLSDEQQQVVSLRFISRYSIAEVAELMDKTEGAVKALQHRALASLRRLLEFEHE